MSNDPVIDDSHLILNYKIGEDEDFPYKIQLPIRDITSDITIDWGDGTVATTHLHDYPEHDYAYINDGEYTITISGGQFSHFGYIKPQEIEEPDPLIGIANLRGLVQWGSYDITNMSGAFYNATGLLSVPDYIPENVTDLSFMFERAASFNQDISNWNVSNVTTMEGMFKDTAEFNNGDASFGIGSQFSISLGGDISKTINMSFMFDNTRSFNQDISSWDVSKVTTMAFMFVGTTSFNNGDESFGTTLNPSRFSESLGDGVTNKNMAGMFETAQSFNQSISSWNVSTVTSMEGMFKDTHVFNNGDESFADSTFSIALGRGDPSKIINMTDMFVRAIEFNQDISSWDVSKVITMAGMFFGTTSFNNGGESFGTTESPRRFSESLGEGVTNKIIVGMFENAQSFNQSISSWNVSKVITMAGMFIEATSFNNGGESFGTTENPSRFSQSLGEGVTNKVMEGMFLGATAFNKSISSWNVSKVITMSGMFIEAIAFNNGKDIGENGYLFLLYNNGDENSGLTTFNNTNNNVDEYDDFATDTELIKNIGNGEPAYNSADEYYFGLFRQGPEPEPEPELEPEPEYEPEPNPYMLEKNILYNILSEYLDTRRSGSM
jgi:surface protein